MNFEQKKNTKAIVLTVAIHSLLLLLFLLPFYTVPALPDLYDGGIEVNLGTTEDGFGTDQPENTDDPAAENASVAKNEAASADNAEKEINTTEEEDAPVVNMNRPKTVQKPTPLKPTLNTAANKRTPNQSTTTTATKTAAQSPRYVYPGATGKGGNSAQHNTPGGNEGIGNGDGDMGKPGGTPGASNYTGTPGNGGGTSMQVSLSGRSLVNRPDPKAEFREGGRVKIHVTVNKEGVITNYRVTQNPNATITAIAIKKLQGVKFNKSASAPPEQFGDIIFDFKATRK